MAISTAITDPSVFPDTTATLRNAPTAVIWKVLVDNTTALQWANKNMARTEPGDLGNNRTIHHTD